MRWRNYRPRVGINRPWHPPHHFRNHVARSSDHYFVTDSNSETRYFVQDVSVSEEIPLATGVMVPVPRAPASAASR